MSLCSRLERLCDEEERHFLYLYLVLFPLSPFHPPFRHFNLRMKRDTQLFAEDLKVEVSGEEIPYDTSHIYTGELYGNIFSPLELDPFPGFPGTPIPLSRGFPGEKGTLSHGAIVDGKFEGFIQSYHGNYYVEPAERYLHGKNVPFHSVIYHEDDIRKCGRQQRRHFLYVGPANGAVS